MVTAIIIIGLLSRFQILSCIGLKDILCLRLALAGEPLASYPRDPPALRGAIKDPRRSLAMGRHYIVCVAPALKGSVRSKFNNSRHFLVGKN